jgi:hypothetical protein
MDAINFSGLHNWSADNNAEALAGAIRTVADQDLAASGLRASAFVKGHYCWKEVFARLFAIYREVIASYNP